MQKTTTSQGTEEISEKEKDAVKEAVHRKVDAWAQGLHKFQNMLIIEGRKGNLRALLANLQLILWENSGWEEVKLGDLLQPNKLKICYHKSLMLFHPDKTRAKSFEQVF